MGGQHYYAPFNYTKSDILSDLDAYEKAAEISVPYMCPCSTCVQGNASSSSLPAPKKCRRLSGVQDAISENVHKLNDEITRLKQQLDSVQQQPACQTFEDWLFAHGGLNRFNLTNPKWHQAHPTAAQHLFGFNSYEETLATLWAIWPDLLGRDIKQLKRKGQLHVRAASSVTKLEKCLIARMKMRRFFPDETLALMVGRERCTISDYLNEWMPKYGVCGVLWHL